MRFKALLAALAAALCTAPSAFGATVTVTEVERIPFDSEVFSECTFEDIDVEGTMVVVSHITTITDDDGNIVATYQHLTLAVAGAKGVTESGERVTFTFTDIFEFNFSSNGADTSLTNLNQQIVAQGPNNNSFLDFTFHGTFTPNGKFTGFVANVRAGCR